VSPHIGDGPTHDVMPDTRSEDAAQRLAASIETLEA
jgi:hypothetical protein